MEELRALPIRALAPPEEETTYNVVAIALKVGDPRLMNLVLQCKFGRHQIDGFLIGPQCRSALDPPQHLQLAVRSGFPAQYQTHLGLIGEQLDLHLVQQTLEQLFAIPVRGGGGVLPGTRHPGGKTRTS